MESTFKEVVGTNEKQLHQPVGIFDAGLGSYAIVEAVHNHFPKQDIIYYADRKHFPYGAKTKDELKDIIQASVDFLANQGCKFIILASNSPSITVLNHIHQTVPVIGIYPPLKEVVADGKKATLVLGAKVMMESVELKEYIAKQVGDKVLQFHGINASPLINLIENGDFIRRQDKTRMAIKDFLDNVETKMGPFDSITLSSTHLPWLASYFQELRPDVTLYDPAEKLMKDIGTLTSRGSGTMTGIVTESETYPAQEFIDLLRKLHIPIEMKVYHD